MTKFVFIVVLAVTAKALSPMLAQNSALPFVTFVETCIKARQLQFFRDCVRNHYARMTSFLLKVYNHRFD